MPETDQVEPLESPLLDVIGLVLETAAGFERALGRHLEREAGMSLQSFEVLIRLARTPGNRLRMSDLAAQTTLSVSGLTRAVDRLVAAGLVAREACDTDRRVAYAVLTPAGQSRTEAAAAVHVEQVEVLFADALSPIELETLSDGLRKVRAVVNPEAARASACPPDGPA